MTLNSLREKVIKEFLEFTTPARAAAVTAYTALTAAVLYTIAASGGAEAAQALGLNLSGGVLTSLLASHLYDTKDAATQRRAFSDIEQALRDHAEAQGEIQQVLSDLSLSLRDLSDTVRDTRGLTDDDRAWLQVEFANLRQDWQAREEHERALRTAYLNHLLEAAGRIDLIGIDRQTAVEEDARRAEVEVSAIYVPLRTSELEEVERWEQEQKAGGRERLPAEEDRARNMLSAVAQLDRHKKLVLLGDPGSGKSTFAKFAACCLAGEALGSPAANLATLVTPIPDEEKELSSDAWSHGVLLPVMVELRTFAARGLPPAGNKATGEHLWQFIARELTDATLGEYAPLLKAALRREGGLLLLDGLDEVPEADRRRRQLLDAVEDFAAAFPACRLLVTSRTYAYLNQQWRLRGFHEAMLMPFDAPRIKAFIERWYAQVRATRRREAADAEERARKLMRAVADNERLFDLARRPLILTLMAALHDWRGGELPEKRWQLYEDTVDLLLERWNRRKTVRDRDGQTIELPNLAEWLKIDRGKVRSLLNRLAFKAHAAQPDQQGTADIAEQELVNGLFELTRAPKVHPADIIEFLQERAGLLIAHGERVYTFPHRTIQEYLAACYLTDFNYPYELEKLLLDEPGRWQEIALLAGAKAANGTQAAIWQLADALCPDDNFTYPQKPYNCWGALIGGLALVESADLEHRYPQQEKILTRMRSHLCRVLTQGMLPVLDRAAAGNVLAAIGDPRFHGPDLWCLPNEDCFGFLEIPAGPFPMGNDEADDPDANSDEAPRHEVTLPAYYMARFPVTAAQFRAFVEAEHYAVGDADCLQGTANHPVVLVSWQEAMDYCAWLNRVLHEYEVQSEPLFPAFAGQPWIVGLPSEAEWEKATRGTQARKYPWGPEWDATRANGWEAGIHATSAVGCFPGGRSPYGCEEMSGNVWEWCADWFNGKYYRQSPADNPKGPQEGDARVLRGGSWDDVNPRYFRAAHRNRLYPGTRNGDIGFRCVIRSPGH